MKETPSPNVHAKDTQQKDTPRKKVVQKSSLLGHLKRFCEFIVQFFGQFFRTFFRARDSSTRQMAWLFVSCCIGISVVSTFLIKNVWIRYKLAHSHQMIIPQEIVELEAIKKLENERYDFKKQMERSLDLGKFTVELDHPNGDQSVEMGAVDLAEVEVSVMTDTRETQEYLRTHLVETRDQVTRVLTAIPRRELMSREGKRKINIKILRKLNHWLHRDAITEAYISNLLVD